MFLSVTIIVLTFCNTSRGSTVAISNILLDLARTISNLNSMMGLTMSKNSEIFWPTTLGRIWKAIVASVDSRFDNLKRRHACSTSSRDLPMDWMTISSPNTMMKGNISNRMEEETAGSLASSRIKAELMTGTLSFSNFNCKGDFVTFRLRLTKWGDKFWAILEMKHEWCRKQLLDW